MLQGRTPFSPLVAALVLATVASCNSGTVGPPKPPAGGSGGAPGTGGTGPGGTGGGFGGAVGGGGTGGAVGGAGGGAGRGGSGGGAAGMGGGAGGAGGGAGGAAGRDAGGAAGRDGGGGTADMRPPTPTDAGPPFNPPPQPPGPWARGIKVGLVEASQAVFIKIGEGDNIVPVASRNAPLIEGRPIFFRVHTETESGFMARQLRAVLTTEFPDGTKTDLENTRMVTGSSQVAQLNSTFNFLVPADKVKAGGAMAISVYETGMPTGAEPTVQPKFAAELGVKGGKMEVHVVVVPVGITSDTPERRTKLANDFWDLYPIQKVNIRVGPAATLPGAFSSSAGFAVLRDRRMEENGEPWKYYHMIINTSGASFAGVAGGGRQAITITRTPNLDGNTNTFAHEIGHNHGSSHMPGCGAAGAETAYPYTPDKAPAGVTWPAGFMGVNGYSLSTNTLKPTSMFRELMSYCRPRWISDYVYKKFEVRARMIQSMIPNTVSTEQQMAQRSLQGWISPGDREINFGVTYGALVDESATSMTPDRYAILELADGSEVRVPVSVSTLTDDVTKEFAINLQGTGYTDLDILRARVHVDGHVQEIDVGTMAKKARRR
jgi:hypothetical protein